MLRNCKVDVVVVGSVFCYTEITKMYGGFHYEVARQNY